MNAPQQPRASRPTGYYIVWAAIIVVVGVLASQLMRQTFEENRDRRRQVQEGSRMVDQSIRESRANRQ